MLTKITLVNKCVGVAIIIISLKYTVIGELVKCPEFHNETIQEFLPHENNCTLYYSCLFGVPSPELLNCPHNQEFSVDLKQCEDPKIANCSLLQSIDTDSTVLPATTTTATEAMPPIINTYTTPNPPLCPVMNDPCIPELFPVNDTKSHPFWCSFYWKCAIGEAEPVLCTCRHPLKWNNNNKTCDYTTNATCNYYLKINITEDEKYLSPLLESRELFAQQSDKSCAYDRDHLRDLC